MIPKPYQSYAAYSAAGMNLGVMHNPKADPA